MMIVMTTMMAVASELPDQMGRISVTVYARTHCAEQ
jgi:hypothetical protein